MTGGVDGSEMGTVMPSIDASLTSNFKGKATT